VIEYEHWNEQEPLNSLVLFLHTQKTYNSHEKEKKEKHYYTNVKEEVILGGNVVLNLSLG